MSSKKNSKLDLLVRVRYSNPLPSPPCPPKLLEIPTTPLRYARPGFLDALANDTPLPMIVDAEMGMPLDLGRWEALWMEEGATGTGMDANTTDIRARWAALDAELNPDPDNLPELDAEDAALLEELAPSTSYGNGTSNGLPSLPAHVPWLRKTEYISREGVQRSSAQEPKTPAVHIDVSRDAQLRDIEASFAACNENFSLSELRHPNKPNVVAVESYEILPDEDIWSNQYDLFRFSERPGDRPLDEDDPRLDCAILRPMKTDHDAFLAYYLTQDDESAMRLKATRQSLAPYEVSATPEEATFTFQFVRDYETVKVEQDVQSEFMLVLEDGDGQDDMFGGGDGARKRTKAAYYKNIERKILLKKKRVTPYDSYADKWELIRMTHVEMDDEQETEKNELMAEVKNPRWMREEADADGEEVDESAMVVG
ncbi:hypothetical protein MKEN_01099900 [Mycena kentingensis (nom. inval.)]|nr:hypothetical protein MKEN_01099900 [Mycena kentingensis (nom. inval.)]